MRKTIAQAAADYLNERNGDRDIEERGAWMLDCGMLDDLHEIYHRAKSDAKQMLPFESGKRRPRAARERYAVLDALGNTSAGKELFECHYVTSAYPGMVNGISRIYILKHDYRHPEML